MPQNADSKQTVLNMQIFLGSIMKTVAVIFFLCSSTSSLAETSHQSVLSFTKKLLEHIEEENFEAFLQAAPCKEIKEKLKEVTFQELVQEFSDSDRPKTVEKMLRDLPSRLL